ncbi:MAG: PP2C family protein-serine/threonine phosphatase [Bradymonadaceae bacterium]
MKTTDTSSFIRSGTRTIASSDLDLRYSGATHIGQRRTVNQDRFLIVPNHNLFMVADGMGGHAAGEVAARMAVDMVAMYFREGSRSNSPPGEKTGHRLANAVRLANTAIFQESVDDPTKQGMGTTIVALVFEGRTAYWAHVGDSRLYRIRDGAIMQLTEDHSLLNETIAQQNLQGPELREFVDSFPYKNVLTRALGVRYHIDVDQDGAPVQDGDIFLITSDGAHNLVTDLEMRDIVLANCRAAGELQLAADEIIRLANERGGPDNVTLNLVEARVR